MCHFWLSKTQKVEVRGHRACHGSTVWPFYYATTIKDITCTFQGKPYKASKWRTKHVGHVVGHNLGPKLGGRKNVLQPISQKIRGRATPRQPGNKEETLWPRNPPPKSFSDQKKNLALEDTQVRARARAKKLSRGSEQDKNHRVEGKLMHLWTKSGPKKPRDERDI